MQLDSPLEWLCVAVPAAPALVFAWLTLGFLARTPPPERRTGLMVVGSLWLSLLGIGVLLAAWAMRPEPTLVMELGHWFGSADYGFDIVFQVDALTATMLPVVGVVTLVVARFAVPYMHREPGFTRFFVQLCLFAAGMFVVVLAGSADLMVIGWECVGIASALLVTFFHERSAPPRAATHVFTTYRLCDVGLLVGTMMLHVFCNTAEFSLLYGTGAWSEGGAGASATLTPGAATAVALAFTLAACGKSAQFPLGTWLPRAMEGPTPSSAVFYGGPAVHAGVYLLLRNAPLLAQSRVASLLLVVVGAATALHATIVCRVQSDQKSVLAYATMTQLGLIVLECGLGWWQVARIHLVTHICLRTYQLLRAPSALRDAHVVRATNFGEPLAAAEPAMRLVPPPLLRWAYHLGLERTHVDTLLERWVVHPILRLGARADNLERRAFTRVSAPGGIWVEQVGTGSEQGVRR